MLRNMRSSSRFSPVTLDTQKMGAVLCRGVYMRGSVVHITLYSHRTTTNSANLVC